MSELAPTVTTSALIPMGEEWANMKNMAGILVKSGMLPRAIDTPEKAVTIMLKGRELKVPPLQAFSKISVIHGVPTLDAELMLSLVRRELPTAKILFKAMSDTECVIQASRPGEDLQEFRFTMKDAERMQLSGKDNWKKMPRIMLKWRCVSDVCRTLFSDCLMGASYTPEEINPDVKLDDQGHVIDVPVAQTPERRSAKIAQLHTEAVQETFDEQREKLIKTIKKQALKLQSDGLKETDVFKYLKVSGWSEVESWGGEKLKAAARRLMQFGVPK